MGRKMSWFAINGGFWALVGLWLLDGQHWAWNLFRFLAVVAFVLILLYAAMAVGVKNEPERLEDILTDLDEGPTRSVPPNASLLLHGGGSMMLAAFGHFFWAALILVTILIRGGSFRKIERVWEEHYGD